MECGTNPGKATADKGWSCVKASQFATPPCEGQRRLAIVVPAETLPFVVGGSLCEREELHS